MTSSQNNKWLAVIGVAGIVLIVATQDLWSPKQKPLRAEVSPREVQVIQTLRINESETVKVLAVPDPMLSSEPSFDTRCLIYTNQDLRQTVIKCPSRSLSGPDTH